MKTTILLSLILAAALFGGCEPNPYQPATLRTAKERGYNFGAPPTTVWFNDRKPEPWVYATNLTANLPDGRIAEFGFRSDGVVVWREVKDAKGNQ